MLRALLPRQHGFFELFDQAAAKSVEAAKAFEQMVTTMASVEADGRRIKQLESEADQIAHRTLELLHSTFITPLDRNDIHRLVSRMDDVLDYIEAAAERIHLYELRTANEAVRELARVLVAQTEVLQRAVAGLRDLKKSRTLLDACIEVNRLENEGDALLRKAVAGLFKSGDGPLEVIKWKEIYEMLETATDRCEDVADVIEGIVLEHA
jgi:uncharacterized protein